MNLKQPWNSFQTVSAVLFQFHFTCASGRNDTEIKLFCFSFTSVSFYMCDRLQVKRADCKPRQYESHQVQSETLEWYYFRPRHRYHSFMLSLQSTSRAYSFRSCRPELSPPRVFSASMFKSHGSPSCDSFRNIRMSLNTFNIWLLAAAERLWSFTGLHATRCEHFAKAKFSDLLTVTYFACGSYSTIADV